MTLTLTIRVGQDSEILRTRKGYASTAQPAILGMAARNAAARIVWRELF